MHLVKRVPKKSGTIAVAGVPVSSKTNASANNTPGPNTLKYQPSVTFRPPPVPLDSKARTPMHIPSTSDQTGDWNSPPRFTSSDYPLPNSNPQSQAKKIRGHTTELSSESSHSSTNLPSYAFKPPVKNSVSNGQDLRKVVPTNRSIDISSRKGYDTQTISTNNKEVQNERLKIDAQTSKPSPISNPPPTTSVATAKNVGGVSVNKSDGSLSSLIAAKGKYPSKIQETRPRAFSATSVKALSELQKLSAKLNMAQQRVKSIESAVENIKGHDIAVLGKWKTEVGLLRGQIDTIQLEKDAVQTVSLKSGQGVAKMARQTIQQRVESLLSLVSQLHQRISDEMDGLRT